MLSFANLNTLALVYWCYLAKIFVEQLAPVKRELNESMLNKKLLAKVRFRRMQRLQPLPLNLNLNIMKYLKQGITGKQLTQQKKAFKASVKKTQNSFSTLLKIALSDKKLAKLLESLQIDKKELTPRNLLPYRTKRETEQKNECTAHMLTNQIQRYAKAQSQFADLNKSQRAKAYMEAHEARAKKARESKKKVELKKVA